MLVFQRLALVAGLLSLTACGRSEVFHSDTPAKTDVKPLCAPTEPGLTRNTTSNGAPIRWEAGTCIAVTYEPKLEADARALELALEAWTAPNCTSLCFSPPQPAKAGEDPTYRLHLRAAGPTETPPSTNILVSTTYDDKSGAVAGADLVLTPGVHPSHGDWLTEVGLAIGFRRAPAEVDSALASVASGSGRTALSTLDLQSVCASYPACR